MRLSKREKTNKRKETELYDHYIAIDWSEKKVAIARMRNRSVSPKVIEEKSDIKVLKRYLMNLTGRKILTIEETTTTHWLYVELKEYVDRILICDPYRNKLLSEGSKTDKIDAEKLCKLLRGRLLKEVYHSSDESDESYKIRKLSSYYEDLVKAGVRVQNQKSALYRGLGLKYKKEEISNEDKLMKYIEESQNRSIVLYREEKKRYETLFKKMQNENTTIRNLSKISGIGTISAVSIYSIVIDAKRFENKYKYWSYCGLVYNEKESGGRIYGKKRPRHSRKLRGIYKTAALAVIGGKNDIGQYYEYLLGEGIGEKKASNAIARYIAKVSYAVMKNGKKYRPYQWRESIGDEIQMEEKTKE